MVTASWRTCRGHGGMWSPKFHPNRQASYSVSNILQYGGRPPSWIWILLFWTTHEVICAVWLPCQNLVSIRYSPPEILRFYNLATLAGKCLTTHLFCFFFVGGDFEPFRLILWVVIQTPPKAHPWVTTRHLSHKWLKSIRGFDLAELR